MFFISSAGLLILAVVLSFGVVCSVGGTAALGFRKSKLHLIGSIDWYVARRFRRQNMALETKLQVENRKKEKEEKEKSQWVT